MKVTSVWSLILSFKSLNLDNFLILRLTLSNKTLMVISAGVFLDYFSSLSLSISLCYQPIWHQSSLSNPLL